MPQNPVFRILGKYRHYHASRMRVAVDVNSCALAFHLGAEHKGCDIAGQQPPGCRQKFQVIQADLVSRIGTSRIDAVNLPDLPNVVSAERHGVFDRATARHNNAVMSGVRRALPF